jgi:hypothetical protein
VVADGVVMLFPSQWVEGIPFTPSWGGPDTSDQPIHPEDGSDFRQMKRPEECSVRRLPPKGLSGTRTYLTNAA